MKKSVLTIIQLFVIVSVAFIIASCNKQSVYPAEKSTVTENNTTKPGGSVVIGAPHSFNRRIGAPIDKRKGDKWIKKYKDTHNGYGKVYFLNSGYLKGIVDQSKCIGISLWYAKKTNSTIPHIIATGINTYGEIIKTEYVNTAEGDIEWNIAQEWITNSNEPLKSHFFGSNTFDRLKLDECDDPIRVDYAIDDNNKQVLLLSNNCIMSLVNQYEDDSSPCPSACPK